MQLRKGFPSNNWANCSIFPSKQLVITKLAGAKPDIDTLLILADLFEVSVDYLLGRTDYRTFPKKDQSCSTNQINAEEALDHIEKIIQKAKQKK